MKYSERHPSRFVKAGDLKPHGAVVTIDRLAMEEVGEDKKTKPVLYFSNASKALVLNAINDEEIGKLLGSDDDREWRGERIVLYPTTTRFGGKLVPCIRVRGVDGEAKAEAESENPAPPPEKKSKPLPSKDDTDIADDIADEIPF
jgi:hypothetical protein